MQKARAPTGILRSWLAEQAQGCLPGTALPRLADLARRFGVSERTVRTLVRELVSRGRLYTVRGLGTFVGPAAPRSDTGDSGQSTRQLSADSLAGQIQAAIGRGEYRSGDPLPSVKTLCLQFHVTERTVATAYRTLATRGHVIRVGKRYWVGDFAELAFTDGPPRDVYLFHGNPGAEHLYTRDQLSPAYRAMEQELMLHGATLHYLPAGALVEQTARWQSNGIPPLGVVLAGQPAEQLEPAIAQLVRLRERLRRDMPSVLVVGMSAPGLDRRFNFITTGNVPTVQARTLADWAVRQGFTGIRVFGNADFASPYTLLDLYRILAELRQANPRAAFHYHLMYQETPPDAVEALDRLFAATGRRRSQMTDVLSKYERLSLDDVVVHTSTGPQGRYPRPDAGSREVWVCAQDREAAGAVEWCRAERTPVPERVAILSVENNPSYLHLGISALIPDWHGIGCVMAHALLGDVPVRRTSRGFLRVRSVMLRRRTTT
ncbi:MAG: GntR family transcriptional regulator [Chitinivibrionales bacterium]|nr:GntR family transcriptional regulator [Chitinivibrionales bacterium]